MDSRETSNLSSSDNSFLMGELIHQQTNETSPGVLRNESSSINRMISDISDDSIRQLLKLASLDAEMQGIPEDMDLSELLDFDLPPSMTTPSGFQPFGLQTDFDSWKSPKFQSDLSVDGFLPYQGGNDQSHRYDAGLDFIPEEREFDISSSLGRFDFPPMMYPSPGLSSDQGGSAMSFNDQPVQNNFHDSYGMEDSSTGSFDLSGTQDSMAKDSSVGMNTSQVSLVLGSNVVMLDPRCCPKPAVTVLPSQVIQTPNSNAPCLKGTCIPSPEREFASLTVGEEHVGSSSLWSVTSPLQEPSRSTGSFNTGHSFNFGTNQDSSSFFASQVEDNSMLGVEEESIKPRSPLSTHYSFTSEGLESFLSPKLLDNNSEEEKKETVEKRLLESDVKFNLPNIDQTAEAEICSFVKSVAPQMQSNAWEEVLQETDFEERLRKAEIKVQEHNQELEQIRQKIECGEMNQKSGQELIRKVYNRREAAASRAKREQGLLQAAIKKRTLEKICGWMREHLIGNSELFRDSSLDAKVRRSLSEGTAERHM